MTTPPPDGRTQPTRSNSPSDNRVSPIRPVEGGNPTARKGHSGGGRGCRKKRRPSCNGADRAATAGIPNLKGCRLPAGLSGAMRLAASTDGDVRRRKLNRPKDGCRKPPVRRNQDRVLRAAGDLLPCRGGLSRMHGNGHVRFLGEGSVVTRFPYPTCDLSRECSTISEQSWRKA
jgi:hypothetical protein